GQCADVPRQTLDPHRFGPLTPVRETALPPVRLPSTHCGRPRVVLRLSGDQPLFPSRRRQDRPGGRGAPATAPCASVDLDGTPETESGAVSVPEHLAKLEDAIADLHDRVAALRA